MRKFLTTAGFYGREYALVAVGIPSSLFMLLIGGENACSHSIEWFIQFSKRPSDLCKQVGHKAPKLIGRDTYTCARCYQLCFSRDIAEGELIQIDAHEYSRARLNRDQSPLRD